MLWEASDRVCGKRLRAMVPLLVEAMERHGHLNLAPEIRERVMGMSAATIQPSRSGHVSSVTLSNARRDRMLPAGSGSGSGMGGSFRCRYQRLQYVGIDIEGDDIFLFLVVRQQS